MFHNPAPCILQGSGVFELETNDKPRLMTYDRTPDMCLTILATSQHHFDIRNYSLLLLATCNKLREALGSLRHGSCKGGKHLELHFHGIPNISLVFMVHAS